MHMHKGKSSRHGTHRYKCVQTFLLWAALHHQHCQCQSPKGVSQTGVFLPIFQEILLIKFRFNFFKKLNRSQRVCLKIKGSFQTYSSPTALLINKMKQICFTGLQKITAWEMFYLFVSSKQKENVDFNFCTIKVCNENSKWNTELSWYSGEICHKGLRRKPWQTLTWGMPTPLFVLQKANVFSWQFSRAGLEIELKYVHQLQD